MGKTKIVKTVYNDNKHNVFNEETGEVEDCAKQRRITVEEFVESDDDAEAEDSELFMANITYIKLFRGDGVAMNEKLTLKEIGVATFLSDFICYTDCVLRAGGNKKGKALTTRNLSEMMGMGYESLRKIMGSLKKKEVIGYHSTGECDNGTRWITVNPYLFFRGRFASNWVTDFYKNTYWAKIQRQKVKPFGRKNKDKSNIGDD